MRGPKLQTLQPCHASPDDLPGLGLSVACSPSWQLQCGAHRAFQISPSPPNQGCKEDTFGHFWSPHVTSRSWHFSFLHLAGGCLFMAKVVLCLGFDMVDVLPRSVPWLRPTELSKLAIFGFFFNFGQLQTRIPLHQERRSINQDPQDRRPTFISVLSPLPPRCIQPPRRF